MVCEIRNLFVKVGNSTIINNLSYSIEKGDFLVILGLNGSGKTTLLNTISGKFKYTGSIKLCNHFEIKKIKQSLISRYISVISQNIEESLFMNFSLMQNFLLYQSAFKDRVSSIEDFYNIIKSINPKLLKMFDKKIVNLSGGEKQCFVLSLNLFFKRDLILLDEHTSALDPKTANEVMYITAKKMKEINSTCIMTTHSLDDALKYGNKLIAMQNGMIKYTCSDTVKNQLSKKELLTYCY